MYFLALFSCLGSHFIISHHLIILPSFTLIHIRSLLRRITILSLKAFIAKLVLIGLSCIFRSHTGHICLLVLSFPPAPDTFTVTACDSNHLLLYSTLAHFLLASKDKQSPLNILHGRNRYCNGASFRPGLCAFERGSCEAQGHAVMRGSCVDVSASPDMLRFALISLFRGDAVLY